MHGLLYLALTLVPGENEFPYAKAEAELSVEIRAEELKAHVYRLASPEFLGRRGAGAARASRLLEAAFQRLGLQPAFGKSYFQPIPWLVKNGTDKTESFIGRNVGAVLPGTDPKLKDEWIILSAHFDHLGQTEGKLYPGADDNASGVAALLEIAEQFALQKEKPRRSVYFIAFDQEEAGLLGSTHFATHLPRDVHQLKAFLTSDMIGRSMVGLMDEYVFVLGSEKSARLRDLVEQVKTPKGLTVGRVGIDLIGTRSDYGPFRDRKVPFLFFSTGQHADYHQPTDLPERVDYDKLQKIACWVSKLVSRLANDEVAPEWSEEGLAPDLDEAKTIATLVSRVLDRPQAFPLPTQQRDLLAGIKMRLDAIVKRGKVTAAERTWMLWTARLLMATVL